MEDDHHTSHLHGQDNVQKLVTPQMRRQSVRLKQQLDESSNMPVDWGCVLRLMSDKLKSCTNELSKQRQRVLKIESKYFPDAKPGQKPTIEALANLAKALGGLQRGIDYVVGRLELFGAKAFQEVAKGVIRDREEEEDDWFDL